MKFSGKLCEDGIRSRSFVARAFLLFFCEFTESAMPWGMTLQYHHGKTSQSSATSNSRGPVAVGRFVAPIAGEALSKGGTIMAALLTEWPAIVGPALASFTAPSKLSKAAPGQPNERPAANLLLKVEPARALEVQYMIPQLVERINQALGFRAIASIRLVQAPLRAAPSKPRAAVISETISKAIPEAASPLEKALARMKQGMKARGDASLSSS